ncbi:hypothetical protein HKX42_09380 [Salinisphaera sp. USBA-960]|nr:hypothetical protein [Salifodinibacter halophilus]NNC27086.1 hypothetical protein [Salifodinibacter halophilus]
MAGNTGYTGVYPPGVHQYHFTLYALDTKLQREYVSR